MANRREAKDHMGMWTHQFLEEGDEYFSSMSSFMTNQFNPEFQFMSGLQNLTVGAPSLSSSSSLPFYGTQVVLDSQVNAPIEGWHLRRAIPVTYSNNCTSLQATAIKTPFKDCHHKDAFLHHLNEICQAKTEPSIKSTSRSLE